MNHRLWLVSLGLTLLAFPIDVGSQTPASGSRRTGTENRETTYPAGGGRVVTIRDSQGREVQREEYETNLGQERLAKNTRTNPDTGETVATTYNQDGTLSKETKNKGGDVTGTEELNGTGRVTRRTTNDLDNPANDKIETFEYDSQGRLTQTNVVDLSGDIKQAQMFSYDEDGNLTDASRFKDGPDGNLKSDGKVFYNADGTVIESRGNTDGILDPIRPPAPSVAESNTHTTRDANGTTTRVTHNADGTYAVEVTDRFGRILSLQHLRPGPCYLLDECPIEQRQRQQTQTGSSQTSLGSDPFAHDFWYGSPMPNAFGQSFTVPASSTFAAAGDFPLDVSALNTTAALGGSRDIRIQLEIVFVTRTRVADGGTTGELRAAGSSREFRRAGWLRDVAELFTPFETRFAPRARVQTIASSMVGHGWIERAAAQPQSQTPAPVRALFTSLGVSTGEAFEVEFLNDGAQPLDIGATGLVLEPLGKKAQKAAREEFARAASGKTTSKAKADGYCLELVREPPPPGKVFRVAPPELQEQFSPMRDIWRSAKQLLDASGLSPDSDPEQYFHSIVQWSIWSKENGFDLRSFREAFLDRTKKNFAAANQPWTDQVQQAVQQIIPNRWNDIERVLSDAQRLRVRVEN